MLFVSKHVTLIPTCNKEVVVKKNEKANPITLSYDTRHTFQNKSLLISSCFKKRVLSLLMDQTMITSLNQYLIFGFDGGLKHDYSCIVRMLVSTPRLDIFDMLDAFISKNKLARSPTVKWFSLFIINLMLL